MVSRCARRPFAPRRAQRGLVLFLSLVVLLMITVLAVSGSQTTSLQERMAGNDRDRGLAFQAAEAALMDAERLLSNASLPPFDNSDGLYAFNAGNRPAWIGGDDSGAVITYGNRPGPGDQAEAIAVVARQPEYIIEQFPLSQAPGGSLEAGTAADGVAFYQVTARGFGGRASTVVVLQTVYRR